MPRSKRPTVGLEEVRGALKSGDATAGAKRLYFTGWKHAGENLAVVLRRRAAELDAPIQMCDALSRNTPKLPGVEVLLANCLAHRRRQVVDVASNFPEQAGMSLSRSVRYRASTPKRNSARSHAGRMADVSSVEQCTGDGRSAPVAEESVCGAQNRTQLRAG